MESYIRSVDFVPKERKDMAGGEHEYAEGFRGYWKTGGSNLNSINGTQANVNTPLSAVIECGTLYFTTML